MNKKSVLFLIAGSILTAFLLSVALAPLTKLNRIQQLILSNSEFIQQFDSTYYYPDLRMLSKELAYKQALLKLGASDSIQMALNLSDSSVMLSIKGVVIHQTKVQVLKKDKFFDKMPLEQEFSIFSNPLPIRKQVATIIKEPVVIRHAPKDTIEAAMNAWQPDTLVQNPAFAIFTTAFDIQIIFEQDTNKNFQDYRKKFGFYFQWYASKIKKSVLNFLRFKPQVYEPVIIIKIPANDLRTIYRALPAKPHLVVKL
ncbi:MAG: hypothetical protein CVU09_13600 [Bacteroidetes bacterium HGW-Bacteroidetes-4]|jgi:hypothetical protein|nr:MAG: hypothetical protein CVU09_13600 [Bacteroidetes bacterium HGW-Bacteroidetes-4]